MAYMIVFANFIMSPFEDAVECCLEDVGQGKVNGFC